MMTQHDFSAGAYRPSSGTVATPEPAARRAREIEAVETWLRRELSSRYADTLDENLPADLLDLVRRLPS